MKKLIPIVMSLLCAFINVEAQEEVLNDDAALLFKNIKTKTSNAEKNEIFVLTGFKATADKTQFYFADNSDLADFPFAVSVFPLDLNDDGEEEIGLTYGNMMVSGNAGSSALLFIKNDEGHYISHLGFPGFLAFIEQPNLDFPDVLVGGPGMEFPVYRWTGDSYTMYKKASNTDFDSLSPVFMEQSSSYYTETLKDN